MTGPLTLCCLLATLVGCGRQNDTRGTLASQQGIGPDQPPLNIHSIKELDDSMSPGLTTNEIVARWGSPQDSRSTLDGLLEWRYPLNLVPAEGGMKGTYAFGVRLVITNGRVARLTHDYMGTPAGIKPQSIPTQVSNEGAQSDGQRSPVLKLFVVSDKPSPDAVFIDTPRLPKLGFVPASPSLNITNVMEATIEELTIPDGAQQTSTAWAFNVLLNEDTARVLSTLSSTNLGHKLLIMLDSELLAAPFLTAPLNTGSFMFRCRDAEVKRLLEKALAKMKR